MQIQTQQHGISAASVWKKQGEHLKKVSKDQQRWSNSRK